MHIAVLVVCLPSCPVGISVVSHLALTLKSVLFFRFSPDFSHDIWLMSTELPSTRFFVDSPTICALGDHQTELVMGGRRGSDGDDSRHRSGSCRRHGDGGRSYPMTGFFGGQSSGLLAVNIYQINIALNMIMGGTGNSIFNLQGNQAAPG